MSINRINQKIAPILSKYNAKLSERVILKKTADFYDFMHTYMDSSYTLKSLTNGIDEEKDITMFVLKNNYGLYHSQKYKKMRDVFAKFFQEKGFTKLAKDIVRFDNDGKEHLKAIDLVHIEKITKQISKIIGDTKIKEKISRILAKFL